ncbi:hypothetical protein ATJ97_0819 [Georgenia soli]|uniref:FXSXX-COOH protein n=1 Tax=Georgenia soli TaxID=638953 RepID=A0A2A9EJC6_9MICO|nr:hypothetical protein [Georgenia soli]PFG38345.1 hypothetical protein ATJ97_0819 [Georgenia soli]
MGQTPADRQAQGLPDGDVPADADLPTGHDPSESATGTDPLARLENIGDVPLADQVAVFDAVHAHLSARLTSAES